MKIIRGDIQTDFLSRIGVMLEGAKSARMFYCDGNESMISEPIEIGKDYIAFGTSSHRLVVPFHAILRVEVDAKDAA